MPFDYNSQLTKSSGPKAQLEVRNHNQHIRNHQGEEKKAPQKRKLPYFSTAEGQGAK